MNHDSLGCEQPYITGLDVKMEVTQCLENWDGTCTYTQVSWSFCVYVYCSGVVYWVLVLFLIFLTTNLAIEWYTHVDLCIHVHVSELHVNQWHAW